MISVIIPVYNQAGKIKATLASLEKQSEQDFEAIIVNDGSSDNPDRIVADFLKTISKPERYIYLSQENKGAPAARNLGFKQSRGELVLFCDADIELKPEALATMSQALEKHPEVAYVYSSFLWGNKLFKLGPFDPDRLRSGPYIHTMSLLRREKFPVGGWDESIKKLQDWDLWLTFLEQGNSGYWIDKVLFTVSTGGHISHWLPSFAYKLLPWLPEVKKYQKALAIVKAKHHLI
jgi:glycosyltransferase involved in cell wall biosynthesis